MTRNQEASFRLWQWTLVGLAVAFERCLAFSTIRYPSSLLYPSSLVKPAGQSKSLQEVSPPRLGGDMDGLFSRTNQILYSSKNTQDSSSINSNKNDTSTTSSTFDDDEKVSNMLLEDAKDLEYLVASLTTTESDASDTPILCQDDETITGCHLEHDLLVQQDMLKELGKDQKSQQQDEESLVMTGYEDPFKKLVASTISDPTMKIMSSELGVQEWVQQKVKDNYKDKLPDSSSLPLDVLIQRTMDTIEDVVVHLRRMPYERGEKSLSTTQEQSRKTIVILGSGWAAHALMKVADCFKLRLIVVSPSNHFVFTPMLASSAVGTVEYRSMTESVRSANPLIEEYLEGKATAINVANQTIQVQLNSLLEDYREGEPPTLELSYDHLIVSVGCRVDDKGVPGADKALRLKTCDDAVKLRTSIGECFEYASRPDVANNIAEQERRATFLIVGGGPTGVELAAEIFDLAQDVTRPHKGSYPKLRDRVRVVLAHSGPDLVPQFNDQLRQEALKSLEKKGVEVLLDTRVTEVGDGFAKLSKKVIDEETGQVVREDFELPTGVTVWCAGTKPNPFVEELLQQLPESARNPDGRVKVDKWLRPPMPSKDLMGSVLVLGDAAAFPEGDERIAENEHLPQTAQVAGQQGAFAARMLDRGYNLRTTPPVLKEQGDTSEGATTSSVFDDPTMAQWLEVRGLEKAPEFVFLNLGLLAYLGGGEALSQVQIGDFPLFSYFGSVAFVLWRSVYLVKQVATRNRVLVTFDWIKSNLFGRDMTRF